METENVVLVHPDSIREVLYKQEDLLQQMQDLIARSGAENWHELQKALAERLKRLKESGQQLWSAMSPEPSGTFAAEHRMSMLPLERFKHYCTCIW